MSKPNGPTPTVELLPCPFCGSEADFEQVGGGPMREGFAWSVGCLNDACLGFQSVTTYARKIEAIAAWNTRTPKLTDDAAVERAAMTERELAEQAYGPGYEEYRNKWIGDHEEMCADLVRWFIPRPALAAALEETTNVD